MYLNLGKSKPKKPTLPKQDKPSKEKLYKATDDAVKDEMKRTGYALIWSDTLQHSVAWAVDEQTAERLRKQYPFVYTVEELKELRGISKEALKEYTIKKVFQAKEVDPAFVCPESGDNPRKDDANEHISTTGSGA